MRIRIRISGQDQLLVKINFRTLDQDQDQKQEKLSGPKSGPHISIKVGIRKRNVIYGSE